MPLPAPSDADVLVDLSDPTTCTELGGYCLVCDDPVEPGETVRTVQTGGRRRPVHDDCRNDSDLGSNL